MFFNFTIFKIFRAYRKSLVFFWYYHIFLGFPYCCYLFQGWKKVSLTYFFLFAGALMIDHSYITSSLLPLLWDLCCVFWICFDMIVYLMIIQAFFYKIKDIHFFVFHIAGILVSCWFGIKEKLPAMLMRSNPRKISFFLLRNHKF